MIIEAMHNNSQLRKAHPKPYVTWIKARLTDTDLLYDIIIFVLGVPDESHQAKTISSQR